MVCDPTMQKSDAVEAFGRKTTFLGHTVSQQSIPHPPSLLGPALPFMGPALTFICDWNLDLSSPNIDWNLQRLGVTTTFVLGDAVHQTHRDFSRKEHRNHTAAAYCIKFTKSPALVLRSMRM